MPVCVCACLKGVGQRSEVTVKDENMWRRGDVEYVRPFGGALCVSLSLSVFRLSRLSVI